MIVRLTRRDANSNFPQLCVIFPIIFRINAILKRHWVRERICPHFQSNYSSLRFIEIYKYT